MEPERPTPPRSGEAGPHPVPRSQRADAAKGRCRGAIYRALYWSLEERSPEEERRRSAPGGLGGERQGGVIAGSPDSIREYMDEYLKTGANYFVCSFQWGSLNHEQAMRSLELFVEEVMPHYVEGVCVGA